MLTVVRNFDGETCRAAIIYLLARKIKTETLTLDIREFFFREEGFVTKVVVDGEKVIVVNRKGILQESLETESWAREENMNFPMACAWIVEFIRRCTEEKKFEVSFEEILSNIYEMV